MKYLYNMLLLLLVLSCGNKEKAEPMTLDSQSHQEEISITASQFSSENMALIQLSEHNFNTTVFVTGFVDVPPSSKASVTTFMAGYVKNTPLLIGDEVKKGQLLVTLENPEFVELQQNFLEIYKRLTYLKSEFERQETLYKEKISSQKNFLKAESDYKSNLAHYNGLKQKLNMLNISPKNVEAGKISTTINLYAPIAGSITRVNVSNGSYVSASTEILEIVNTDHIHLELSVFEKDVLKIKKEQHINFKVPEASNEVFNADVHLVGTSINSSDRTVKVHGHIRNDVKTDFVTGMFIEAEIIAGLQKSIALPKEAIIEIDNTFYVFVLKNQDEDFIFEQREVSIGQHSETYLEVLNPNDFKDVRILNKGALILGTN